MSNIKSSRQHSGQMFEFEPFHFEALRALWYAPSGGADYGEVISTVRRIRERDIESWYHEWSNTARQLVRAADRYPDRLSAGNARLRASNYMRTAEFFLPPNHPERPLSSTFAQDQFFKGLEDAGIEFERLRLPYDQNEMEAYLLPVKDADTLVVIHGGFDSTPEELYFAFGRAAQLHGFDVIVYEGPGHGNLLRKYNVAFDPAWERAIGTAIDAALARKSYARIVGLGISMGGHFLARAAAKEKRLDGIVLCDYFPAPIEAFEHGLPRFLHKPFLSKRPWLMKLITRRARSDIQLNWVIENGKWVFGASDLSDLVDKMLAFDEGVWVGEIESHVCAMVGASEHFFDKNLVHSFMARLEKAPSATLLEFGTETGGDLHCRNGAYYLLTDSIFEWLERQVPRQI